MWLESWYETTEAITASCSCRKHLRLIFAYYNCFCFFSTETSYKINVKTSNVRGAGTDANVFVILFGANGDTGQLHLDKSETYKDPFENDHIDVFTFKDMLSVGEMSKCRVWHDNKGKIG